MTAELTAILASQRQWAIRRGIDVLDSGHTLDQNENLFLPLRDDTRAQLDAAASRPRGDGQKPGEIQLLESTTALVYNALGSTADGRQASGLAIAMGGDPGATATRFCAPLGSGASPLEVDLLLQGSAGVRPTAIRATYAEPYLSARPRRDPGNRVPAAWLDEADLWKPLPGCRNLAQDLRHAPRRYEHLAVAELLMLGVALTREFGVRGFTLVHVWYELPGHAAHRYEREVERLRYRIGGEIDFRVLTWGELTIRMAEQPEADVESLNYLRDRYSLHAESSS